MTPHSLTPYPHHEPVRVGVYIAVFAALLTFTGLTVLVAEFDLGELNIVVAITIAVIKASLVAWFFMHLRQASSMTKLFAGAGLFWLAILLAFTISDYTSRPWINPGQWW